MAEPGRREAASAGNSMMVPIVRSLWLPHGHDLASDMHYSEQNVVNGLLIWGAGTVTGCDPVGWPESSHFTGFLDGLFSLTNS
jgi:hypothetical protein